MKTKFIVCTGTTLDFKKHLQACIRRTVEKIKKGRRKKEREERERKKRKKEESFFELKLEERVFQGFSEENFGNFYLTV